MQGARLVIAVVAAFILTAPAAGLARPAAPTPAKPTSRQPVIVAGESIPVRALRHWQQIAAATQGEPRAWKKKAYREAATAILIEHRWIEGEAKRLNVVATKAEIKESYQRLRKQGFTSTAEYKRFLRRTRSKYRDILKGVRIDLLQRRIAAIVTAGAADQPAAQKRLLDYRAERQARWLPQSKCYPQWYLENWCTFA